MLSRKPFEAPRLVEEASLSTLTLRRAVSGGADPQIPS